MKNLSQNQQEKVEKIKEEFKQFKISEKEKLNTQLKDPQTFKFEIQPLKDDYKNKILSEKKVVKEKIINIEKPEFYKKDLAQRQVEKQIFDLQANYYQNLNKLERNLKRAKHIDKNDKSLKVERQQKISDAKAEIKNYKLEQKVVLKNEKEKLELNNDINKFREFKNTTKIVGKQVSNKVLPALSKFANQKHVISMRNAFIALTPLIMVASFINVILSIPIQMEPQKYLNEIMPTDLVAGMNTISGLTMGLMAIGLAIGIGINLGQQYGEAPYITGIMGFVGFTLWLDIKDGNIPTEFLSAKGIFGALICSIIMVEIYRIFKKYKITIRLPKQVPPAIGNSFLAIIPVVFYAIVVMALRYGAHFNFVTGLSDLFGPIGDTVNNGLGLLCAILIFQSVLWWVGIHGSSITNILIQPAGMAAIIANGEWWNSGRVGDVPNLYPDQFMQNICVIGGGGAVIGLAIAALLVSKSKQNKTMARATGIPVFFNISEPIMFGYPIVFNIYLLIPFIFAPAICAVVGAVLCQVFSVVWVTPVPWSMPAIIGAFFAAGNDWKAIVVVGIVMAVATLWYLPFFKIYDKIMVREEREKDVKEAEALGISYRDLLIQRAKEIQEKKANRKLKLAKK